MFVPEVKSCLIVLACFSLVQSCFSLASVPRQTNAKSLESKDVGDDSRGLLRNPFQRQQWAVSFYPDHSPPPEVSLEQYRKYIRIHQTVRKRRSFRRLFEITTILLGQVLRPLICSLADKAKPKKIKGKGKIKVPFQEDWETFWSREVRDDNVSNAQRVADGFQQLGPTFVKLGQAISTRPDIKPLVPLADALATLQDNMRPFDNLTAKRIIRRDILDNAKTGSKYDEAALRSLLDSLSDQPVAAASIAQVYKGNLPGYGHVAIKVQRPGIRKKVERDATLFHTVATYIESIKWPRGTPMAGEPLVGALKLVKAVDEFTERVLEDMEFRREAANMQAFARLYSHNRGGTSPANVHVVVPDVIPELCSDRVLVMEWIEGSKLTDICDDCEEREEIVKENLALVEKAIECTISQLLDTGLLHADPHTGNLLKVRTEKGKSELGYLDFGLVSSVPQSVRDGIVCAVVQLVFARNIEAVAKLCVDLELLPRSKLEDPTERQKFINALEDVLDSVLIWPRNKRGKATEVPRLRFEKLPESLTKLVASFEFSMPPYFLNNARALATLEGIALKLDPSFNILRVIYPYSINRLMRNPTISKVVEDTFMDIIRSPKTKLFDFKRFMMLLNDWALLTGYRKLKIFWDLATSTGSRRVSKKIFREWYNNRFRKNREIKKIPLTL